MIITQQVISPDTKYTIQVPAGLVTYDVHNDSPYNMAINFDTDSGLGSAEYYMSPHSILYGLSSADSAPGYSVGGSRGASQIFVYTQSPLGGIIATSSAPAYSLTIMGYPVGRSPQSTVSLNRLANLGNSVPLGSSATSIVNDGSATGTSVVEATQTGSSGSNVSLLNDGTLVLASYIAGVLAQFFKSVPSAGSGASVLLLGDSSRQVEVLGALKVDGSTFVGPTQIFGVLTAKSSASLDNGAITTDGAGNITTSGSATINGLLTINNAIKNSVPAVSVTGTAGGNISVFQTMNGTDQRLKVVFNNWNTTAGVTQTITLPTPFNGTSWWFVGAAANGIEVLLSGTPQSFGALTTLGATAPGGTTSVPIVKANSIARTISFDTLRFTGSGTPVNGLTIVEG